MNLNDIQSELREGVTASQRLLDECAADIERICRIACDAVKAGRTLYFCGNGGSFTDSLHIVGELVGRLRYDRPGIAAVTLGANTASLTAVGNDYGYEQIFAREVDALVKPGDAVFGLSTSGSSKNVLVAIERAKAKKAKTIGLTGEKKGTPLDTLCDLTLHVPGTTSWRIQESHICVGHILATAVERALYPKT
ncbi:MAG: SIS domain-containing protein [Planctomycetes bacterium]|nr:SIS domain-containing protein [Planctomycetota bacterium]NUQ34944.1 SIS domain-containing protein [Planctomycetaceae bacterium]